MRFPFALAILLVGALVALAPTNAEPAAVDLRADVDRNGLVDLIGDSDEDAEAAHTRAIFLANIDDDRRRCPKSGPGGKPLSDGALAACNDAADAVVNGAADLLDLARLKTVPWPDAPDDASATITVSRPAARFVRIFVRRGGRFVALAEQRLGAEELRAGIELAIEGKDIIRDRRVWDGSATVAIQVSGSAGATSDEVSMRVAPLLLQDDLQPVELVFAQPFAEHKAVRGIDGFLRGLKSDAAPLRPALAHMSSLYRELARAGSSPFAASLRRALDAAGIEAPLAVPGVADPWVQDYFEPGYAAMPAAGGRQHVIRIMVRSANVYNPSNTARPLRPAGRFLFTRLRGRDVGVVQQFDLAAPRAVAESLTSSVDFATIPPYRYFADTLNSGGNFSTIPPHRHRGVSYQNGRILIGGRPGYRPDPSFLRMLEAQGAQKPLYVDTSWLLVGHVDEFVSFVNAPTARGWAMVVLDPRLGLRLLRQARAAGHGGAAMLAGKREIGPGDRSEGLPQLRSAAVTVDQVLGYAGIVRGSLRAAAKIEAQVAWIKRATGLTDDEIVRVPGLHARAAPGELTRISGWRQRPGADSAAFLPAIVNGLPLTDRIFAAPDPHGPVVAGRDVFKRAAERAFGAHGIRVHWVEDFHYLHLNGGEVHCGTNLLRAVDTRPWWASKEMTG